MKSVTFVAFRRHLIFEPASEPLLNRRSGLATQASCTPTSARQGQSPKDTAANTCLHHHRQRSFHISLYGASSGHRRGGEYAQVMHTSAYTWAAKPPG